jgi:hypothetical protein
LNRETREANLPIPDKPGDFKHVKVKFVWVCPLDALSRNHAAEVRDSKLSKDGLSVRLDPCPEIRSEHHRD